MEFEQLQFSDAKAVLTTITSLRKIQSSIEGINMVATASCCTSDEKMRISKVVGHLRVTCVEILLSVLTHNEVPSDSNLEVHELQLQCHKFRASLSEDSDSLIFSEVKRRPPGFTVCSDLEAAKEILSFLDDIDESVNTHAAALRKTKCAKKEIEKYFIACGEILTFSASLRVEIYLDHEKLIPNKNWWEIVDSNKRLMERQ